MAPAEVDILLAYLADAAVALPQAARQLGDVRTQAKEGDVFGMDPDRDQGPRPTIETVRLHLDGVPDAALDVYRLLNARLLPHLRFVPLCGNETVALR